MAGRQQAPAGNHRHVCAGRSGEILGKYEVTSRLTEGRFVCLVASQSQYLHRVSRACKSEYQRRVDTENHLKNVKSAPVLLTSACTAVPDSLCAGTVVSDTPARRVSSTSCAESWGLFFPVSGDAVCPLLATHRTASPGVTCP